jgi:hypothetical protein
MDITPLQSECFARIHAWLSAEYFHIITPDNHKPLLVLTQGSAAVAVEVRSWQNSVLVSIWTYVVTGAQVEPSLLRFLLRQNELLRFGGFSLDDDRDIKLQAHIYGENFSRAELLVIVKEVLESADHYDDQIMLTWGGKRAIDHVATFAQ